MNNFIKSRVGEAIISGIAVAIIAIISWPLLDLLISKIFTHSEFSWNFNDHIIHPILVGVFFGIFEYIFQINQKRVDRKSSKKKS